MPALSTTTRQHVAEGSPNQSDCPPPHKLQGKERPAEPTQIRRSSQALCGRWGTFLPAPRRGNSTGKRRVRAFPARGARDDREAPAAGGAEEITRPGAGVHKESPSSFPSLALPPVAIAANPPA